MRKIFICLFVVSFSQMAIAQWNLNTTNYDLHYTNGNVGIGTTTPDKRLTIASGGNVHMRIAKPLYSNFFDLGIQAHFADIGYTAGVSTNSNIRFLTNNNVSMYIQHDGKVGIGTNSPIQKLQVHGSIYAVAGRFFLDNGWGLRNSINDYGVYPNSNYLQFRYNGQEAMRVISNGNVGIGTTSPSEKLEVVGNALIDGEVYSKRIKVSVNPGGWPDYVFERNYQLISLDQLEQFISINKHLPNVPSAKEVESNGQDVGDIQATLLQKVEELTLYLIDQNKKQLSLEERLEKLEAENTKLKALLKK